VTKPTRGGDYQPAGSSAQESENSGNIRRTKKETNRGKKDPKAMWGQRRGRGSGRETENKVRKKAEILRRRERKCGGVSGPVIEKKDQDNKERPPGIDQKGGVNKQGSGFRRGM